MENLNKKADALPKQSKNLSLKADEQLSQESRVVYNLENCL